MSKKKKAKSVQSPTSIAFDMEKPIADAQGLVMALMLVGTHPDMEDHHQHAINTLAWAIRGHLADIEIRREEILGELRQ